MAIIEKMVRRNGKDEKHYFKKVEVNKQTRFMCVTCEYFYCKTISNYPHSPDDVDYECKMQSNIQWKSGIGAELQAIWERMEQECLAHNVQVDHEDFTYIGLEYPCFLWKRKLIEICELHKIPLDDDVGCPECYVKAMKEIDESAEDWKREREQLGLTGVIVTCGHCGEQFDEGEVEEMDIEENELGQDKVTFDCPNCHKATTSLRLG